MPIEVYSSDDLKDVGFARVLIKGPPKLSGKTVMLCKTAPRPFLCINCDGKGAPNVAKRFGATPFDVLDVGTPEDLEAAVTFAITECKEGKYAAVGLDTFTLLVNTILVPAYRWRFRNDKDVGFATYRETANAATRAIARLNTINAHLFVTAHAVGGDLNVEGKMKQDIPAMLSDLVTLEYDKKRDERFILAGVNPDVGTGGRLGESGAYELPADLCVLLKALELNPYAALPQPEGEE